MVDKPPVTEGVPAPASGLDEQRALERGPRWSDVLVGVAITLLVVAVTYGLALRERRRLVRRRS